MRFDFDFQIPFTTWFIFKINFTTSLFHFIEFLIKARFILLPEHGLHLSLVFGLILLAWKRQDNLEILILIYFIFIHYNLIKKSYE